jgi:hypothetical protein
MRDTSATLDPPYFCTTMDMISALSFQLSMCSQLLADS